MYKFRKFLYNENSPGFEELDLQRAKQLDFMCKIFEPNELWPYNYVGEILCWLIDQVVYHH